MNTTTQTTQLDAIKSLRFGIEVETVGVTRPVLAAKIQAALPGSTLRNCGYSDSIAIVLPDGREWKLMHDGSLSNAYAQGEIVSPILTYADMEMLQTVVRTAREAGANADDSCGIHVHVDAASLAPAAVARLARFVFQNEALLIHALGIQGRRLERYTKALAASMVAKMSSKIETREQLSAAWYGRAGVVANRYDSSRYHGLNLNSYFFRGTVEFRYFNGTMHAGKIRGYVQLCLALVAHAKASKGASSRQRAVDVANARHLMGCLCKRVGMNGDEFKTARLHLCGHLQGKRGVRHAAPEAVAA